MLPCMSGSKSTRNGYISYEMHFCMIMVSYRALNEGTRIECERKIASPTGLKSISEVGKGMSRGHD